MKHHELKTFTINGTQQHALIRGRREGRVLLLVQAGPGFPLIHEADALEQALHLEDNFLVAYWDQRGTGKSFASAMQAPFSIDLMTRDVMQMCEAVCVALGVDQLDVAGFSLGGSLALLAAQRSPHIRRVVAVGPDIDLDQSEREALRFATDQARRLGHHQALRELRALGAPPHDSPERFMTRVKWVTNFGGIAIGANFLSLFFTLLVRLIRSRYYRLSEAFGALRSMQQTQRQALRALTGFSLDSVTKLEVPVTIIQGRLDAAAPAHLSRTFVDRLEAPAGKRFVLLDDCAHTPHFEVPLAFRAALLDALQPDTET